MSHLEAAPAAKLDIGRAISDTVAVVKRRWPVLLGLSVVSMIPSLLNMQGSLSSLQSGGAPSNIGPVFWVLYLGSVVLGLFVYGMQLHVAISDLRGEGVSLKESARVGLRKILPLLGLIILMTLALMLGLILLVAPAIILAVMWSVSLPAIVGEQIGPIRAFGRSRALTRGNRWRLFLLFLILYLPLLVVYGWLGNIVSSAGLNGAGPSLSFLALLTVLGIVVAVLGVSLLSALYIQLRGIKEGGDGAAMATVFD